MSDESPADLLGHFRARTDDEKQESFAWSTLQLVLRQLGATREMVDTWSKQYGPALDWRWLNDTGWLRATVTSARALRFNLVELLSNPTMRHPVAELYFRAWREESAIRKLEDLAVVFRCYELGRLVACSWQPDETCIQVRIASMKPFYVTRFGAFFTRHFGNVIGEKNA